MSVGLADRAAEVRHPALRAPGGALDVFVMSRARHRSVPDMAGAPPPRCVLAHVLEGRSALDLMGSAR